MDKTIKIYQSFRESEEAEMNYISSLSHYERLKSSMDLIKSVYSKQILENKKAKKITLIVAD